MSELERRGVINQYTLRSILPGKVSRTVMIIAVRDKKPTLQSLKDFYLSSVYARLEQEESKYWWMSPDQLAQLH